MTVRDPFRNIWNESIRHPEDEAIQKHMYRLNSRYIWVEMCT